MSHGLRGEQLIAAQGERLVTACRSPVAAAAVVYGLLDTGEGGRSRGPGWAANRNRDGFRPRWPFLIPQR